MSKRIPSSLPQVRLFVSYAHSDERALKPLRTHLTLLGQNGYIQHWDDTQLIAGDDWHERIMEELDRADIVLLIYSTHSRASKFIREEEAPRAVALGREKKCKVVVVPLYDPEWDNGSDLERELKKLQTATWNAKPVLDYTPQRKGWEEVRHAIRKTVEKLR